MIQPSLTGRTALVTGSAAGIGRAIALALADAGADVAVHYYRSDARAAATAQEAADRGVEAGTFQADVTDPESVDDLFGDIAAELGPVDVLVNNVGDFDPRWWDEHDADDWHRVLDTNLLGTAFCARRALQAMRENGWGRIVNVGYAGSEKALAYPRNFPYLVAKTGVLMFTRMLAADTQDDGVTVNAVSPYVVETSDKFPDHEPPRGRWARVGDLAQAVLFFCDEDSGYVSGENVEIDGGWLPERL